MREVRRRVAVEMGGRWEVMLERSSGGRVVRVGGDIFVAGYE